MAKTQSFADKLNKGKGNVDRVVMCPDTNKETKLINVRLVESVKTEKGSVKFLDRNALVYESTYKPYKGN
ncbi:MAG: hypothetical protein KDC73_00175 [Ignavibacteriae bacterium]|nr:hypothetical protein [Ignavibacteriota bacterium]MCB9242933.1 hypothetical protein [Ignavibacteriales bacterium]